MLMFVTCVSVLTSTFLLTHFYLLVFFPILYLFIFYYCYTCYFFIHGICITFSTIALFFASLPSPFFITFLRFFFYRFYYPSLYVSPCMSFNSTSLYPNPFHPLPSFSPSFSSFFFISFLLNLCHLPNLSSSPFVRPESA